MYSERIKLYKEIEKLRNSKILVYITGDKPAMETRIHAEVLDLLVEHLDTFGETKKISLYLYSTGGNTLAGWGIVNLIRQFCKEFEVIIPSKAYSTATLICMGANNLVMTKQATLSPIDPSITSPLNPQLPGGTPQQRVGVSVEAIAGYFGLAKEYAGLITEGQLKEVMIKLSDHVHPVALGEVFRARTQIQMLGKRLLSIHMDDEEKIATIVKFLCSESGSHDYTINRKEAKEELSLPIEIPDDKLYQKIKAIYDDIRNELELGTGFEPNLLLGNENSVEFKISRALIESVIGGKHTFMTTGKISKHEIPTPQGPVINPLINIISQGWRYEKNN